MSRCYPYPPPGFEKKPRTEQADLLEKEKHKEKKHKKEKREKEKREGKERKDGERSKDKHKGKKDHKEKHKDRKKDKEKKDKEKDNDKNDPSDDRRVEDRSRTKSQGEQKVVDSQSMAVQFRGQDSRDQKFMEEHGRRIKDEQKGGSNRMVESFTTWTCNEPGDCIVNSNTIYGLDHRRTEGSSFAVEMSKEKAFGNKAGPSYGSAVQRPTGSEQAVNLISLENRRSTGGEMPSNLISAEKRSGGGKMCTNNISLQQRRSSGNEMPNDLISPEKKSTAGQISISPEERKSTGEMSINSRSSEQRGCTGGEMATSLICFEQVRSMVGQIRMGTEGKRSNESEAVPNFVSPEQKNFNGNDMAPRFISSPEPKFFFGSEIATHIISCEQRTHGNETTSHIIQIEERQNGLARALEVTEKRIEGKEKIKGMEGSEAKRERHRDREEKRHKGKDKDRHKEKKKEKIKEEDGYKHNGHDKAKDIGGNHTLLDSLGSKQRSLNKDDVKSIVADEGIKKRKHSQMKGFLLENDARPDQFCGYKPSSSFSLENGITTQSPHFDPYSIMKNSLRMDGAVNHTRGVKMHNERHPINGMSSVDPPPLVAVCCRENDESSSKPPHPDSKYLSKIFSVPTMSEWPEFDEQEWLFGSRNIQRRPDSKLDFAEPPKVWGEALQIDSGDFALPYVIPY